MFCTPTVKPNKVYRMHNSDAMYILNCACVDAYCFTRGVGKLYPKVGKFKSIRCESKHVRFFSCCCFFELETPTNVGKCPRDFGSQVEISVRVQRGGFMVKAL